MPQENFNGGLGLLRLYHSPSKDERRACGSARTCGSHVRGLRLRLNCKQLQRPYRIAFERAFAYLPGAECQASPSTIMRHPRWRRQGAEPDYRFSLANERTFLAWIRTGLALLAGGVLLHQFSTRLTPHIVVLGLAVVLGTLSAVLTLLAYWRWRANEIAMRLGQPLPSTLAVPLLASTSLLVSAVIVFLVVWPQP
jgi:putative membrane protein